MDVARKPFQGVGNIIRFNWHFYGLVLFAVLLTGIAAAYWPGYPVLYAIPLLLAAPTLTSLLVSYYIYDHTDLYRLQWIDSNGAERRIVNIHAGFDETTGLLRRKFPQAAFYMLDFYDPQQHTEPSIKRARRAYPAPPGTISVRTDALPVEDASADKVFVIFAAHEIRNRVERAAFIRELARIIRSGGEIYITEHLRDTTNFLAFNIGFLHFYSSKSWLQLFQQAGLTLKSERKLTPFISTFILMRK